MTALPVVRLAVVDGHKVTSVSDPRHATFTMYSFLKAVASPGEVEGCYGDFKRQLKASSGGDASSAASRMRLMGVSGGAAALSFRTAQSNNIVNVSEAVASTIFGTPAPLGLHPMGLGAHDTRYLVGGAAASDAAAQERRQQIYQSFVSGVAARRPAPVAAHHQQQQQQGGGMTSPFAETQRPTASANQQHMSPPRDGHHDADGALPQHTISNEHFSSSPFGGGGSNAAPRAPFNDYGLGASPTPFQQQQHTNAGANSNDTNNSNNAAMSGGTRSLAAAMMGGGGGGITIEAGQDKAADDAVARMLMQRGGRSDADHRPDASPSMAHQQQQQQHRSPSQHLEYSPANNKSGNIDRSGGGGGGGGGGASSPSTSSGGASSSRYSPHMAATLRDLHDGVASTSTLNSRDLALRNKKEVLNNKAIDLFARIAAVRAKGSAGEDADGDGTSPTTTTSDAALLSTVCDQLAARLRNVQLFQLLQRHEEETLMVADMALRSECEAMKRQLRDVISALVRSEGRLTGDDDSLPPSDGRYVSEHFLFEQIQDVLQDASQVV